MSGTTPIKEAAQEAHLVPEHMAISKKAQYTNIVLTEEEAAEALRIARQAKSIKLEKEAKVAAYEKQVADAKVPFTPETLFDFILCRVANDPTLGIKKNAEDIPELIVDDDNKNLIRALCYYFTGDERFTKFKDEKGNPYNWSLEKGIMLCGGVGTGKTTIMKLFSLNKRFCYTTISCRQIADNFADFNSSTDKNSKGAHEILRVYAVNIPNSFNDLKYFLQPERGYCFDDLGTEEIKKNFGNEVNVMQNILSNRYDKGLAPFYSTHVTTNLTVDEIENIYGDRVRSRMRQMFNMIELKGKDRRK